MVLYGLPAIRSVALVCLQGCGDGALRSARHQIGGLVLLYSIKKPGTDNIKIPGVFPILSKPIFPSFF
jgi:hypothetical protein